MNIPQCILLLEDNPDEAALIMQVLRSGRIANQICTFTSGEDGLAYLKREGKFAEDDNYVRPSLILLDLHLHGMSGLDFLRQLRREPNLGRLPVVVLTCSSDPALIEQCYQAGANSYLVKPLDLGSFRQLVKSIDAYWVVMVEKPGH